MDTKIVTIDLDVRSYDIYIGSGLLFRLPEFLPMHLDNKSVFIVTDRNVQSYAGIIKDILVQTGVRSVETLVLRAGEKTKSFPELEKICQWLLDNGVNRNSVLFAVGGGVIGDVAGFAASVIMRGIPFVQVPTTLLAQVDSSVGGKTGINTPQGKNLVGSFYQPEAVIADTETLKTLPRRELLAGYAEVVKYGLIDDEGFFNWLEQHGREVIDLEDEAVSHAIEISARAKAGIVEYDERESGRRALLNLGHTFGHALEAVAGYDGRLLHGEAVSIGMVMAFDLSARMELCSREEHERVEAHLMDMGLPTRASQIEPGLKTSVARILEIMQQDKKASGGKLKFILANGIGEAFITDDVSQDDLEDVIRDSLGSETEGSRGKWRLAFSSHS